MRVLPPTPAAWRGTPVARLTTALPDLLLSAGFLITWIAPLTLDEKAVSYFLLVMLLEFLIVHSAGFMGSVVLHRPLATGFKVRALAGLGGFYLLFAAGFALGFRAWWPIWTILGLTLNRILIVLLGEIPDGKERQSIQKGWAASTLFYVVLALLTVLLPVPALGVTAQVIDLQAFTSTGLWVDEPQRVLAFGFLYFLATGASELVSHRWLPDASIPSAAPSVGVSS